jgi:hypothetical protein
MLTPEIQVKRAARRQASAHAGCHPRSTDGDSNVQCHHALEVGRRRRVRVRNAAGACADNKKATPLDIRAETALTIALTGEVAMCGYATPIGIFYVF